MSTRCTRVVSPTRTATASATSAASSNTLTISSLWASMPSGSHRGTPPRWPMAATTSATTVPSILTSALSATLTHSWHGPTNWACESSSTSSPTTLPRSIRGSRMPSQLPPVRLSATATSSEMAAEKTANSLRTTGHRCSEVVHGNASLSPTAPLGSGTCTSSTSHSPTGTGKTPKSSRSLTAF